MLRIAARWVGLALVFGLTLEAAARVDDAFTWGAPLLGPYSHARLTLPDTGFGFRNRPGYRFEKWAIDSLGFRGPDIARAPRPGVVRVGVLGASETFGLFEAEGGEYPARLGALLDSLRPGRYEVVNYAQAGMGLVAMRAYVERVVAPTRPRVVLVYPALSFYLDDRMLDEAYIRDLAARAAARPDGWEWRLAPKAKIVAKRLLPASWQDAVRRRALRRARTAGGPGWVWDAVPLERLDSLGAHADRLFGAVRAAGAEPVLVTHTTLLLKPDSVMSDLDRYHWSTINTLFPRAAAPLLRDIDRVGNARLRAVAAAARVPVIEAEGRVPPDTDHFGDYSHFTDRGADAMARLLAPAVIALCETPGVALACDRRAPEVP